MKEIRPYHFFMFLPVLFAYFAGMFVNVMDVDAAQYATMSREMLERGDYLQVMVRGSDYLDKPPLIFWLSSLSFRLFGISDFAYKLPSVVFSLLGIYSTFRLGKQLYDDRTGWYAALILSSTQAWFMMNNDVRTDTILAASVIFSIWQLNSFILHGRWLHLVAGAFGIAAAMLTKGPIGLMVPVLALGSSLLLKRDYRAIFHWKWLVLALVVGICLAPMVWGLYRQFDLHPGKEINGQTIGSGVRFYFWTQSFGRITGESNWSNHPLPFYFAPVLLWSFAPWTIFLIDGLVHRIGQLFRSRFSRQNEIITLAGFVLPFIAFSFSRYKLPHYIFVIYPLGAIIAAAELQRIALLKPRWNRISEGIHFLIAVAAIAGAGWMLAFVFPLQQQWLLGLLIIPCFFLARFFFAPEDDGRAWKFAWVAAVTINMVAALHFYPRLLEYQAPSVAGKHFYGQRSEGEILVSLRAIEFSLDVYAQQTIPLYWEAAAIRKDHAGEKLWVFTDEEGKADLDREAIAKLQETTLDNFRVSLLKPRFLDPSTRNGVIGKRYLFYIQL